MSRLMATAALAFAVLGTAGGASAQGLVTMQKLSAPLANELVGDTVATCAQKGYAVTAVLVILEENELARAHGRLATEGIDVRHVNDEASLSILCQRQMVR